VAVATGELTPADGNEISKLIDTWVKAFETAELAARLERFVIYGSYAKRSKTTDFFDSQPTCKLAFDPTVRDLFEK
jgi:hypothetical protein